VEVKGLGWLGIRTAYFEQTVALFRDVMNLEVTRGDKRGARRGWVEVLRRHRDGGMAPL
jgi:hypothetical protein